MPPPHPLKSSATEACSAAPKPGILCMDRATSRARGAYSAGKKTYLDAYFTEQPYASVSATAIARFAPRSAKALST